MAAFDTPWMGAMSSSSRTPGDSPLSQKITNTQKPTIAAFVPTSSIYSSPLREQRPTLVVNRKSPLLVATPPQVTRALAYSHPFILPLNKVVGLLSWTTDDPWESFLLLAGFWAITLYGDVMTRCAGPVVLVGLLTLGLYGRRYSPLSSTSWAAGISTGNDQNKKQHQKSLDEIVETLKLFTSRCNVLLSPFLRLTEELSTQRNAISATTKPALMTLFMRLLILTPIWYLLTLPPFYIITTKRVILTVGTVFISWHSSPATVSRTILWRSLSVRRACSVLTGLPLSSPPDQAAPSPAKKNTLTTNNIAAALASRHTYTTVDGSVQQATVRFTFVLYENQRKWLGLGWTSSMLAYERASWTDDQLNPAADIDSFELPDVYGGVSRWRWVEGSAWVSEAPEEGLTATSESSVTSGKEYKANSPEKHVDDSGWVYYDTKWRDGRRQDGWGRYTRRRKWCRDAELVEVTPPATPVNRGARGLSPGSTLVRLDDASEASPKPRKVKHQTTKSDVSSVGSGSGSFNFSIDRDAEDDDDGYVPMGFRGRQGGVERDWGVGEDIGMGMG